MKQLSLLLYLLFLSPAFPSSIKLKDFANSSDWLSLLHYEKNLFGSYKSRLDGKEAFLHEKGKENPLAELIATIKALNDNTKSIGKLKQKPWCAFVARRKLLLERGLIEDKKIACEGYDFWAKSLNLESVKIIFASYYTGNPASLFGHTFLKFNLKGVKHDYLNYGLNFAATTGSDGAIVFAVFGLMGMYEGHYSLAPYYIKLKEYSLMENRHLFEYELNLNEREREKLVDRIWEIESIGHFDYYFFDENCSFQILAILESIRPQQKLTSGYSDFVLPLETIKTLHENNFLKNKKFIHTPSLVSLFEQKLEVLSDNEQSQLKAAIKNKTIPIKKMQKRFKFKNAFESYLSLLSTKKDKNKDEKKFYNQSLVQLSQQSTLKLTPEQSVSETEENPIKGHGPHRLGLGSTIKRFHFSYYHGLHDIYDSTAGYDRFSTLNYLGFRWSAMKNTIRLEQFSIFEVLSLNDFTYYNPKFSFETNFKIIPLTQKRSIINPEIYGGMSKKVFGNFLYGFLLGPKLKNFERTQFELVGKIPFLVKSDWGHLFTQLYTDGELEAGQSFILNTETTLLIEFKNKLRNEEFLISLRRNF